MNDSYQLLLSSSIKQTALRCPDNAAVKHGKKILTYRQLADRIRQVFHAGRALGLQQGDRVMLMAPNCLEYFEIVAGLADIGVAVVTVSPYLQEAELMAIHADCNPVAIIVATGLAALVHDSQLFASDKVISLGEDYEAWLQQAAIADYKTDVSQHDTFAICYTSGTTGKPKGVCISHYSRNMTFLSMQTEYGCYQQDNINLALAPLYHGGGFAFSYVTLFYGGTVVICDKFEPEITLKLFKEEEVSNVFMVPTHFSAIFQLERNILERYKKHSLDAIISNAAPLSQNHKEMIVDFFGEGLLFECYGSTEAGIVSNLAPVDQLTIKYSVGQAFPLTEIKITNDQGETLKTGETGEIFSRSPYLFNGYWQNEQETEIAFSSGWVSAGDLGHLDERGYLFIDGRKKDMIISGGVNIYPREIEEVLLQHAAITDSAVVGIKDEHWGEKVCAYVVMNNNNELNPDELQQYCQTQLAKFKVPKEFYAIDSIPKNPAGKVLKRVLREQMN